MKPRSAAALGALALALCAAPATAVADDLFTTALSRYGWKAALPAAFLAGLGTALTPCVYPMVAITVSVFGARREKGLRAALLSTAFVAGIAAFFVPLGLAAALSGTVAGQVAGLPAVQILEAVLMFAMALSMFGLFDISLPSSIQTRLASVGGLGMKGAFVIGLAMGPIAAPCATAPLVGILDYVFHQRDTLGGGFALLAYSLGLGAPFWVVGTLAVGLPKPGIWMDRVKSFFGVVLTIAGLYYLRHLVPFFEAPPQGFPAHRALFAVVIVAGLLLGAIHLSLKDGNALHRVRKTLGIACISLGAVWWINWLPPVTHIPWRTRPAEARDAPAQARASGRPVLMDFGANWCAACEELSRHTFTDPAVRREASRFITIKVDASTPSDEVEAIQRSYRVQGLPTVLVFDSRGREAARLTEFVPARRMLALLRSVD